MDDDLRPGAEGKDGGPVALGHDGGQHRSRQQPGAIGPRQAEVAGDHGRTAHDQLRVLARTGGQREPDQNRGLHAPGHALDREGRVVRQQRPLVAVERPGPAAPGPVSSRPLDPGRSLPACEEALPGPGRQVSRPHHEPDLQLQGSAEAGARRDRQRDQRQGPDHRQADDLVRKPERRWNHHDRRLDLHGQLSRFGEPDEAAWRHPGPEDERSDRDGLLSKLVVELAAQPPRHVQPRIGGPRRQAMGSGAAGDHVGRQ